MSEWYEAKDDDIEADPEDETVSVYVKNDDCGAIYVTLTFEQVRGLVKEVNTVSNPSNITPLSLRKMAQSIASTYGDDGAIVITKGKDGYRFGVEGLAPDEVERAACLLIHYNFAFSDDPTSC